jgi:hypothetical protein
MKGRITPLAAALALLVASGCGSNLVKVTGRLTYKGEPVPSTNVTFFPDDGGRPSHGVTDDNGNFTLKYTRKDVGVTRGKHTVFLRYEVGNEEYLGEIPPRASKEVKEVIAKYGERDKSPLHYEVTRDGDHFDINLE